MKNDERLVIQMEATLARFQKQMERAEKAATRSAQGSQRAWDRAGKRMQDTSARSATALSRVMNISGGGRFVLQNTAAQLGDIAVQMEGGVAPSRVMAQQLPQVFGGFSALGGALGIVAPLLGTVAAVGIPIAAMMMRNGDASADLTEKTVTLTQAIDEYIAAAQQGLVSTDDLAEKYGTATHAAQEFIVALQEINRVGAVEALDFSVDELAGKFADLQGQAATSFAAIAAELANLEAERQRLNNPSQLSDTEFATANRRLDEVSEREAELRQYAEALSKLQRDLNISADAAGRVADALANISTAEGPRDQARAAQDLIVALERAVGPYETMNAEARAIYERTVEIGNEAARLQGQMDQTASAVMGLSGAIEAADGVMGGLLARAGALTDQFYNAAAAAWDMAAAAAQAADVRNKLQTGQVGPDAARDQVRQELTPNGIRRSDIVSQRTFPARPSRGRVSSRGGGGSAGGSGAGSGGAAAAPDPSLFEDVDKELRDMQRRIDMIGRTEQEVATLTAKYRLLDEAKERGIDLDRQAEGSTRTVAQEIDAQAEAIGRLTAQYDQATAQAEFYQSTQERVTNGMVDAIVAGEGFGGVLRQLAADLARAQLQAALFGQGPLGGDTGGGILGGLTSAIFGGFRAGGGPVDPGRAYVVGERGPEMIVPRRAGTVVPNHALGGGGGGTVHVVIEESEGFASRVRAEAEGVSVRTVKAYDRSMPDRIRGVMRDPRRT